VPGPDCRRCSNDLRLALLLWRLNLSDTFCDRQEKHRKRKPQHYRNEPSELGAIRAVFNIQRNAFLEVEQIQKESQRVAA
jgi:hypothetical protein